MINGIIGVRFARNCHPDDLWTKYFTSSVNVMEYRWLYGEPDVIEIRQTFNDSIQAREWEHKVLRRLKVIGNDRWLNKGTGKAIPPMIGCLNPMYGRTGNKNPFYEKTHSYNSRMKMSESHLGNKNSFYGKIHSVESKQKISNKLKGKYTGINNSMYGRTGVKNPLFGKITVFNIETKQCESISKELYYLKRDIYFNTNSKVYKDWKCNQFNQ